MALFFLNIGNKPKDPWIAWDIAYALRKYFVLQNVIHWIKSIAINKTQVGNYPNIAGDIAVGHFKPIVSKRFLNDCHEYIFHFTKYGDVHLDKLAVGVHIKIRQTLSAGRLLTKKINVIEATHGSYLIKLYKVEVSSVLTLQRFLSIFQICASGCMAVQN